ncbi:MAG: pseudaminic acid cytidylyltransferase [Gammaproteobacteria bacterium]|nr:pseudaminic acid cytidylyltransferase [Gammaproteobacteria bacterium]|tara:strand:- start:205 stop:909 length:705 start_codon:yes stop_codon:yes gene_type:complete
MKDIVAIIPARGGSKRITKKNLKKFLGKEIISYPIKTALESKIFKDVVVSTDDIEIAELAKKLGASVPFMRSEINSNDVATTFEVIDEVLGKLSREYKLVCCLYPTSVFATKDHLELALDTLMKESNVSCISSVVQYSHPIERRLKIKNKYISFCEKEKVNSRSQDLEVYYHDAGQFYFARAKELLKEKKMILTNSKPIILKNSEAQDIDTYDDWSLAELKYSKLLNEKDNTVC